MSSAPRRLRCAVDSVELKFVVAASQQRLGLDVTAQQQTKTEHTLAFFANADTAREQTFARRIRAADHASPKAVF